MKPPRAGYFYRFLSGLLTMLLAGGCTSTSESFPEFVGRMARDVPRESPSGRPRVVLIGIDGLPSRVLKEVVASGPERLPHLRRFVEEGLIVDRAVAPLPSLSITGWLTIASGQPPGGRTGHGIHAFHWVDRDAGRYYDLLSPAFFSRHELLRERQMESFFADFHGERVASYGFYYAPHSPEGLSATRHGLLELGLGVEAEPLALAAWSQSLALAAAAGRRSPPRAITIPGGSPDPLGHALTLAEAQSELVTSWQHARELLGLARGLTDPPACRPPFLGVETARSRERWARSAIWLAATLPLSESEKATVDAAIAAAQAPWPGLVTRATRAARAEASAILRAAVDQRRATLRPELSAAVENLRSRSFPRLTVFSSYDFDFMLHRSGVPSAETLQELEVVLDAMVGEIFAAAAAHGGDVPTYFVLVSDHGGATTSKVVSVSDLLERAHGLKVKRLSVLEASANPMAVSLAPDLTDVYGYDALVASTGGGYASIDLSVRERSYGPDGAPIPSEWAKHPTYEELQHFGLASGQTIDLIEVLRHGLLAAPAPPGALVPPGAIASPGATAPTAAENVLDFFILRDVVADDSDSAVRVISPAGMSRIHRRQRFGEEVYAYEVLEGQDPLGYTTAPSTSGLVGRDAWHDDRTWQAATTATSRPDLINRISHLMDSEDSGTISLFFAEGWSGNAALPCGRHGGALAEELDATLAILGPGVPRGARLAYARLEDVRLVLADLARVKPRTRTDLAQRRHVVRDVWRASPNER